MPSHDALLTDDAVAERLISEANDYSLRFSAAGLDAGRARPENKPKPNTRFLRNIIRTTETHNAALLAKEAAESQARLQELREAELHERRRHRPEPHEVCRRQMRDISAIIQDGRQKRMSAVPASSPAYSGSKHPLGDLNGGDSDEEGRGERSGRRSREHRSSSHKRRVKETCHSRDSDIKQQHKRRPSSPDRGPRNRHRPRRERSPLRGEGGEKHGRTQRSRQDRRARDRSRSKSPTDNPPNRRRDRETEDSDPLDDIIGPLPPPSRPIRGRGNTAHASGIDARFSDSYDPASDIAQQDLPAHAGSSANNTSGGAWDDVVEAFRDRQKWKAQGAERLRAAGFTETQIQKWERGDGARAGDGGDADLDNFCWSKKGEMRQWDRGKTVNADGSVSTGPEWAK